MTLSSADATTKRFPSALRPKHAPAISGDAASAANSMPHPQSSVLKAITSNAAMTVLTPAVPEGTEGGGGGEGEVAELVGVAAVDALSGESAPLPPNVAPTGARAFSSTHPWTPPSAASGPLSVVVVVPSFTQLQHDTVTTSPPTAIGISSIRGAPSAAGASIVRRPSPLVGHDSRAIPVTRTPGRSCKGPAPGLSSRVSASKI